MPKEKWCYTCARLSFTDIRVSFSPLAKIVLPLLDVDIGRIVSLHLTEQ